MSDSANSAHAGQFNEDELEAPSWLNKQFFTTVLLECTKAKTIMVKDIKLSPASLKGDHYASVMFRAQVEYESSEASEVQSMSMIIKTMPEAEGHKKEFIGESFIFETEIGMYKQVLPKYREILSKAGVATQLNARCLYASLSPKKLIVFEDLLPLGYKTLRERDITLEEVKLAYFKLAKLHAVSHMLLQENPEFLANYKHGEWTLPDFVEGEFQAMGIVNFIELLESQPALQEYVPHFEKMRKDFVSGRQDILREYWDNRQSDTFYVLCHGDFHSKNMMFKHDAQSGQLQDIMLLDYQICNINPMVADVSYSLYMLLTKDLRANHYDELLYYYFKNFRETLSAIGFKGELPKYADFSGQMLKYRYCELFLLTTMLPLWYAFSKGVDAEALLTDNVLRRKLYQDANYISELHDILPFYLHRGYFDD